MRQSRTLVCLACVAIFASCIALLALGPELFGPAGKNDPGVGPETSAIDRAGEREALSSLIETARSRKNDYARVHAIADEVLAAVAADPSPKHEIEALVLLSWAEQGLGDYQKALTTVQKAEELAEAYGDAELASKVDYQVAVVLWRLGQLAGAREHAQRARENQQTERGSKELASTLTLLGVIERARGDMVRAIEFHFEAMRVSEDLGDKLATARSHNNIGLIYWGLSLHDEALSSLDHALGIYREAGVESSLATMLSNIGLVLVELDRSTEALPLLFESLTLYSEAGNAGGRAKALSNLAFAHETLGDSELAHDYGEKSLAIRERLGDKIGMARSLGSIAGLYQDKGDHALALPMLERALALAQEVGALQEESSLLASLSEIHEEMGEFVKALDEYRLSAELDDELRGSGALQRVTDLVQDAENVRRERKLARIEAAAEVTAQQIAKEKAWKRLLFQGYGVLGLSLIVMLVLYFLRERALRRMAESESRYRALFENSAIPTLLIEVAGRRVIDMNAAAADLCDESDEAGPRAIAEITPEWVGVALGRLFEKGVGDEDIALDDCWIERSGRLRWTELRGNSVSVSGRACVLVRMRDTTELRAEEAARLRSDKLESLGLLAGGIAHDFNNALTSIIGHIGLAKGASQQQSEETLDLAEQAAVRASSLTSKLLAFSRGGEPVRRVHDVSRLLEEAVELAGSGSSMAIDLDRDRSRGPWPVLVDEGQLAHVVSNLIINADQATSENGRLSIRLAEHVGDPETGAGVERYVRVDFRDNGEGIPEDVGDRVFDPYFTTKVGGSGMGLATAFAIVANHGGAMTFESTEGQGTLFSVFLPAANADVESVRGSSALSRPDGDGRVLVLDDEPLVRNVYRRMLEKWGYDVEVAAEGKAAVELYLTRLEQGRRFDLLIMDLTIPGGMGGRQAIAEILQHDPTARAIVASGYSDDPTMAHYGDAGFVAALAKPFREEELGQVIRGAMFSAREV